MIITNTITKKWNSNNKERFTSYGYDFTEIGDEIEVDVNHLGEHDISVVLVECDQCKGVYETRFRNYKRHRQLVAKSDSCKSCGLVESKRKLHKAINGKCLSVNKIIEFNL